MAWYVGEETPFSGHSQNQLTRSLGTIVFERERNREVIYWTDISLRDLLGLVSQSRSGTRGVVDGLYRLFVGTSVQSPDFV